MPRSFVANDPLSSGHTDAHNNTAYTDENPTFSGTVAATAFTQSSKSVLDTDHTAAADPHTGYLKESVLTTKGDLYAATAADTPARLAVGSDRKLLKADSGQAAGVGWAYPTAIGCRVTNVTNAIPDATSTVLNWDTETLDTDAFHDTVTNNSRITIPAGLGGKYLVGTVVEFGASATGHRSVSIEENGGAASFTIATIAATLNVGGVPTISGTVLLDLVATDYLEVKVYQNSTAEMTVDVDNISNFWVLFMGV